MNNKLEQKLLQTYSNKIIFKNIENFEEKKTFFFLVAILFLFYEM